jgi:hypothetical protein
LFTNDSTAGVKFRFRGDCCHPAGQRFRVFLTNRATIPASQRKVGGNDPSGRDFGDIRPLPSGSPLSTRVSPPGAKQFGEIGILDTSAQEGVAKNPTGIMSDPADQSTPILLFFQQTHPDFRLVSLSGD